MEEEAFDAEGVAEEVVVVPVAVADVADDRVPEVGEVAPELVATTGLWEEANEGVARGRVATDGGLELDAAEGLPAGEGLAERGAGLSLEGAAHLAAVVEVAAGPGEVAL